MSTFIAFDTETATPWGNEICSIAFVVFAQGKVARSWQSLVNPGVRITPAFEAFHGIRNAAVQNAPRFAEVWAHIAEQFAAVPVVAHNAAFDRRALFGELARLRLPEPAWRPYCTVKMARKIWPKPTLMNHKLNTVAAHMGVALNHHEALSDATACGHIAAKAWEKWGEWPEFARA